MNRDIKAIDRDASVREAARLMRDKGVGSLLVESRGDYIGIVSETDVVRRGVAQGLDVDHAAVHLVMSERGIRHLVITEEGKMVGVLSVRDLLVYFKNQF